MEDLVLKLFNILSYVKIQIKTTLRFHLTLVRMDKIKGKQMVTNVGVDIGKGRH